MFERRLLHCLVTLSLATVNLPQQKSPASRVGNEGSESAHASTIEAVADGSIPRHGVSIPRVVLQLIDLPLAHDLDLAGDGSDVSSKVLGEVEFTKEVIFAATRISMLVPVDTLSFVTEACLALLGCKPRPP